MIDRQMMQRLAGCNASGTRTRRTEKPTPLPPAQRFQRKVSGASRTVLERYGAWRFHFGSSLTHWKQTQITQVERWNGGTVYLLTRARTRENNHGSIVPTFQREINRNEIKGLAWNRFGTGPLLTVPAFNQGSKNG
jgi:hypothetical protein